MTNKEMLLNALMKEYARALNRGARLGDNDEYLEGVYDGEERAYAFAIQLVKVYLGKGGIKMTFKELYFCNDRWDETSILTVDIQSLDSAIPRRKHLATPLHDLMVKYDDYAVEAFKNDWIILREV